MFAKFARFISRYWIAVLVAWVIIPVVLHCVAPRWDEITHDGDFAYLPSRLSSVRGTELLEKAFPEMTAKSTVVLVAARPDSELTDEDKAVALRLADMFTPKPDEKTPVSLVMTHEDKFVGSKLRSPDGQSVLVLLQLNNEFMAVENMKFINEVYRKVREIQKEPGFPSGLQLGVTGSAPVGSDMLWSMKESIDNTELTTILLVTTILLIVYRSPGLVLVPLVSIGVSFFASLNLIALVAQWADRHPEFLSTIGRWMGRQQFDFQVFTTTHIFIVVVLFGAATDYCLFLIARYREELERGLDPQAALEQALGQTGPALTASAMTTILGLGAMIFADFGKYRSGGPTIAISLIVALLASMTVAPAMLRAFGRAVFWPFGVGDKTAVKTDVHSSSAAMASHSLMGRFWNRVANVVVSHPGLILVGSFLVLAVPAWHGFNVPITYDMLAELNPKRESVQGTRLLEKHFLIGKTGPITVLAYHRGGNFDTTEQYVKIRDLTTELTKFNYVDSDGKKTEPIREVSSLTNPLGEPLTKKKLNLWRDKGLSAREIFERKATLEKSRKYYLSGGEYAGEVARFDLVCDYDPFSQESMRLLGKIDDWLKEKKNQPNSGWHDVEFDFVGVTAGIRDLDAVNQSDTQWVGVYVALAVLIVLIFLLRRPLLSLYLIFTVVFGYLVSLGLTHLFFGWFYGNTYQGLDWKLKIFLFVILVAVGEDYNIYLVTRVVEEQRRRGLLEGLREAIVRTGGIITSCGVIMAGTFGSMATGTLRSMIELGFAMSLGVLLDTFIIRTVLVPAFLALLARWGVRSAAEAQGDVASPHFDSVGGELVHANSLSGE
ncbi:MAG: MMPL family transporter [Planctomycetota bacterium]